MTEGALNRYFIMRPHEKISAQPELNDPFRVETPHGKFRTGRCPLPVSDTSGRHRIDWEFLTSGRTLPARGNPRGSPSSRSTESFPARALFR